jgi:hypothetical protein
MLLVLGREVVEGQQGVAILDQALDRFVVFDAQVSTRRRPPRAAGSAMPFCQGLEVT